MQALVATNKPMTRRLRINFIMTFSYISQINIFTIIFQKIDHRTAFPASIINWEHIVSNNHSNDCQEDNPAAHLEHILQGGHPNEFRPDRQAVDWGHTLHGQRSSAYRQDTTGGWGHIHRQLDPNDCRVGKEELPWTNSILKRNMSTIQLPA